MNVFSFLFWFFLVLVFICYYLPFYKKQIYQNSVLLLASTVFYCVFSLQFYLLLVGSSVIIYLLTSYAHKHKYLRIYNYISLIPICVLLLFKYLDFFVGQFSTLVNAIGFQTTWTSLNLILPLGISFYSFKQLCYIFDLRNGKITSPGTLLDFLNYVMLFNTITAGPIDRPNSIFGQFAKYRIFNFDLAKDGLTQVIWGVFKKIVIADVLAILVDEVWSDYYNYASICLITSAVLYSFQIYFDFSGYSDIAIGIGKLLGLRNMQNFRYPYFSRTVSEFWRRWHISLTSWFTEYIYIPLGGSYLGKSRRIVNTLIVFLISGLWHGANWTFIIWGGYHGLLFIPNILANKKADKREITKLSIKVLIKVLYKMFVVFVLVTLGWMMFRSPSLVDFYCYLVKCFSLSPFEGIMFGIKKVHCVSLFLLAFVMYLEWKNRHYEYALEGLAKINSYKYSVVFSLLLILISLYLNVGGGEFIYANF